MTAKLTIYFIPLSISVDGVRCCSARVRRRQIHRDDSKGAGAIGFIGTTGNCRPFFSLPNTWRFLPHSKVVEKNTNYTRLIIVLRLHKRRVFIAFARPATNTVVVNKAEGVHKTASLVKKTTGQLAGGLSFCFVRHLVIWKKWCLKKTRSYD